MIIVYILIFISTIVIDQWTKFLAISKLKDSTPIVLIDNFLQLSYVENRGAAFGILQNKQTFFIIITTIVFIGLIIFLIKDNKINSFTRGIIILIFGGAVGNYIDRIRLNFVVDFIDVNFGNFYDFPVFNASDSFTVIGTIILIYLVLFDKYEKRHKNG